MKAVTFLFPIIFFFSCTTQPTVSSEPSAITGMAYNATDDFAESGYSGGKISYNAGSTKVIIHNAYVRVTVKNVDSLHNDLKRISESYGGYVLTLGDREAVIRVKAGSINPALAEIARTGKLKSKTVRGEDVTEEFMNLQVRLENAKKARQRYLELLEKASNVDEALKVEKELERLNLETDLLEGKLNKINHLVEYSTISVGIEKKKILGPLGYLSVGIYKIIKVLFVIK